jgi:hypothetical protein
MSDQTNPGQNPNPSDCKPMAEAPHVVAAAPVLATAGVLANLMTVLNAIGSEVNPLVAATDANKGWQSGGLKGALDALIADQDNVFPDSMTRGFAVFVLTAWARLASHSTPKPNPKPNPTPAPTPAPTPQPAPTPPPGPTPLP